MILEIQLGATMHWRRNRGGGGATGARAPLNFGVIVLKTVRGYSNLYVSIPEGKITLEIVL